MHYSDSRAHTAKIVESTDGDRDGYKSGWIKCQACGWKRDLGDGFLQTTIETCALCDSTVATHTQHTVTVGRPGDYTIYHGTFEYMHTESICVWYKWNATRTEYTTRAPR